MKAGIRLRDKGRTARHARSDNHTGALEPRRLLSTTPLPVVDPDFNVFYKPGSTAVTAVVPDSAVTDGLGPGVAVQAFAGTGPVTVNYSDGTSGTAVDVPGWAAAPSVPFAPPTQFAGVLGEARSPTRAPPAGTQNSAYVVGGYAAGERITQTLAGVSLRPGVTYTLSAAANVQAATSDSLPAAVIGLEAGGTMLTPASSSDPAPGGTNGNLISGNFTRTYAIGAAAPSGPVTIVLGVGPGVTGTGRSANFGAVHLTADDPAPAAVLSAPAVTTAGGTTETVTATYAADAATQAGIDLASITPANLTVTGPGGRTLAVTGVTTSPGTGSPAIVTATYTVAAPAGGWSSADNGAWIVSLGGSQVTDTAGRVDSASVVTTFQVNVVPAGAASGATDPTFAPISGNRVSLGFTAESSAIAPNGLIYAAGRQSGPGGSGTQAVLERLDAGGTVDFTYGTAGVVTDAATNAEAFYGVAPLAGGGVLVAGTSGGNLLLARYNADGSPDLAFGDLGRAVLTVGSADATAYALAVDPSSGAIVVAGGAGGQFLVDRFTASGAADPAFNGGQPLLFGNASDPGALGRVAVLSDGRIVAAGAGDSGGSVFVARVTADGALDSTFGAGGATPGLLAVGGLAAQTLGTGVPDTTEGLAIDPQGNVLVANRTPAGRFGTVRLGPDGTPDPTFGTGGLVATSFGGSDDADYAGVSADGSRIYVAGTSTTGGTVRTAVAAYTTAGALDTTFGTGGTELLPFGTPAAAPAARPAAAAGTVSPLAESIGSVNTQVDRIVAALNDAADGGTLLIGNSQQGINTATSSLTRLVTTATPLTPLPAGTLGVRVAGVLPASVVGGARARASVTVTVSNPAALPFSGPVTVTLYVAPGASLDGAATLLTFSKSLKLKPGQARALKLKIGSFPSEPAGTYTLIATAGSPDGTTTGAAGPALSISPAFVSVKVSAVQPQAAPVAPGKRAVVALTLTSAGNEPAAGALTLTLTAASASASSGPLTLATVPLKVKLKAGAGKVYRVKFAVPAGTAAGSYTLTASLNVAALGDATAADGVAASASPLTVA